MERKRKRLSHVDKTSLITDVDGGMTQKYAAEKYGVKPNSVSGIMKNKVKITTEKKFKASLYSGVDQDLRAWFEGNRARKVPISGDLFLAKAADIGRSVNLNPPSMVFINSFKKRHEILFRRIHGESGDADKQGKEEWLKENLPLIMFYAPSDVYKMDESGLFFRALPSGTLCFKEEVVKGTKTSKDRITLAVRVNMDGSYKELLAIGKSANPRCFRKKPPVLPCMATSKAWRTVKTFKGWIKEFDTGGGFRTCTSFCCWTMPQFIFSTVTPPCQAKSLPRSTSPTPPSSCYRRILLLSSTHAIKESSAATRDTTEAPLPEDSRLYGSR